MCAYLRISRTVGRRKIALAVRRHMRNYALMIDLGIEVRRIEALLCGAHISVRQFCRAAQIAPSTWGRWKAGITTPTLRTWVKCLHALNKELQAEAADPAIGRVEIAPPQDAMDRFSYRKVLAEGAGFQPQAAKLDLLSSHKANVSEGDQA